MAYKTGGWSVDEGLKPVGDGGLSYQLSGAPNPQSGMDRAEWFALQDGLRYQQRKQSSQLGVCSAGKLAIGANMRGVQGVQRDSAFDSVLSVRHNYAENPDPSTLTSSDALQIWDAQVRSSAGFVDGDKEVYVNQDTQTIWAPPQ